MKKPFDIFMMEAPDALAVHWGWALFLGLAIGALGVFAVIRSRAITQMAVSFYGILFLVSSVLIILFDFSLAGFWPDFFVHVLWASLVGIVGFILLSRPLQSAEALTLLISFYFIVGGLATIGFAFSSHVDGLWIHLVQGGTSFLLGSILLAGWPITGDWAIGTFIGVDLLFKGSSIIAMALGLRAISEGGLF
jgi:uncharacterized membrane protein HdeD (DUF308 family)